MKEGAFIESVEKISELEESIALFAVRVNKLLQEANVELKRKRRLLEQRYNYWKQQKNYWLNEWRKSDDRDEVRHINEKINETEEKLRQLSHWKTRIQDVEKNYRYQAHNLQRIVEVEVPRARNFLRENIEALKKYLSLQPNLSQDFSDNSIHTSKSVQNKEEQETKAKNRKDSSIFYNNSILPDDFRWISLDEIKMEEINDQLEFKKISYEEMKSGLQKLKSQIIPALSKNNNRGKEFFREQDRESGLSYSDGQLKIYEAFFGGDHIRLDKNKEKEKYSITNGRHRIKVARDLGWEAIPAQAVEVNYR